MEAMGSVIDPNAGHLEASGHAANVVCGLQHGDVVAGFGCGQCRSETGWAGADDDDGTHPCRPFSW